MEGNNEVFNYTYSASQQAEIKSIREKYMPHTEEDKIERLRRLDRSVTKAGTAVSITVGVISALVLGIGMCCTMVWEGVMLPGIMIGVLGIIEIIFAYPLYLHVTKRKRDKVAPEIMRLTDELMK